MMSRTQKGVLFGILAGAVTTLIIFLAPLYWPSSASPDVNMGEPFQIWMTLNLMIVIWLLIAIGRLARHRYFDLNDINSSAKSVDSERARILQSILQNTLEQTVLAVIAYGACLLLAPVSWHITPILCAILFSTGRLFFFIGFKSGAAARSFGFTLTFFPSALLIVSLIVFQFQHLFS